MIVIPITTICKATAPTITIAKLMHSAPRLSFILHLRNSHQSTTSSVGVQEEDRILGKRVAYYRLIADWTGLTCLEVLAEFLIDFLSSIHQLYVSFAAERAQAGSSAKHCLQRTLANQ